MSNRSLHLKALLAQHPELEVPLAKAAEASRALLQRALADASLLSELQWAEMEKCLEAPAGWLGSGKAMQAAQATALVAHTRDKPSSALLQEVRRRNLRRLVTKPRKTADLARILNTAGSLLSDLAKGNSRVFGPRRARAMETALGLSDGWFDRDDAIPDALLQRFADVQAGRTGAPAEVPPATPVPFLGADSAGALHQAVLAKYAVLAAQGLVTESLAHELLGKLLALETQPASALAADTGSPNKESLT